MRGQRIVFITFAFLGLALLPACDDERTKRERARIELEEKSRRETEAGNKAISDLSQRMFGKKPDATKQPVKNAETPIPKS